MVDSGSAETQLDVRALDQALNGSQSVVDVFRAALHDAKQQFDAEFLKGNPTRTLVTQRAGVVDQIVTRLWRLAGLDTADHALLAVGGYGRGELHPHSDIDIGVLLRKDADEALRERLKQFITSLWDVGLEVGHSVRTPEQCVAEALADLTVTTNLMEARLLAGDAALFATVCQVTSPECIWSTAEYFKAKRNEQIARHRKYNDTVHNLEPNLKEGPGGLRDIQTVAWVAMRHFNAGSLAQLVTQGFLTEDEFKTLDEGRAFLWRVRYALHYVSGRREDRLLFDYQRKVSQMFGYHDAGNETRGVEQFMKQYYLTVTELSRMNEMLLELFEEAILEAGQAVETRTLNQRFQAHNDLIEVRNRNVFKHHPFALLEIFLLLQQNPELNGVRASTIRLLRDHRHLIDDAFRRDLRARSLFMEIIRQPRRLGHELQRMHLYGILGAYLPIFGAVEGLMQFDLFHVYTVDEHTLFVVRNMRRFAFPEDDALPLCREIMLQLPKPELLYLAGLFHDIAKGGKVDHSELGEQAAIEFCRAHELSNWDTKLVGWLVRNHLIMSTTAQKKDLSDPAVVNTFAGLVGDQTHLNYLYLLTVADICGTNPALWTSWKDALLKELYFGTLRALRRGLENPIEREERIAVNKNEARALFRANHADEAPLDALWAHLDDEYFLRHAPDEIAWQAAGIVGTLAQELPLVALREETGRGGTEIFVYARDVDNLFAVMTATLERLGLTIQDARITTSSDGFALDTCIVLDAESGAVVKGKRRISKITNTLRSDLQTAAQGVAAETRRANRKFKHFSIPTKVSFTLDEVNQRNVMEIVTGDGPGVLSRIGGAMQRCNIRLHNARITTFGERVEDIFYLTNRDNTPIQDEATFALLRTTIIDALDVRSSE